MATKRTCIVTGGSSGIGEAIVKLFEQNLYDVFNLDIEEGKYGQTILCDMTKAESIQQAIESVIQQTGRIDTVISNAGIHVSATIEATSDALFEKVFNLNVKGAIELTKACLPQMKQQESGSFVYVGSDQSLIAKPNSFAYNLSKHAIASIAKTTALDYAQYGIRSNAVCPGTIETPLYHKAIDNYCARSGADKTKVHAEEAALQPIGRLGKAEEVAAFVYFLASDQAGFVTGSLHPIDGGYTCQ